MTKQKSLRLNTFYLRQSFQSPCHFPSWLFYFGSLSSILSLIKTILISKTSMHLWTDNVLYWFTLWLLNCCIIGLICVKQNIQGCSWLNECWFTCLTFHAFINISQLLFTLYQNNFSYSVCKRRQLFAGKLSQPSSLVYKILFYKKSKILDSFSLVAKVQT